MNAPLPVVREASGDGTTEVSIYESPLPDFVAPALEALYRNVFASVARLTSLGLERDACAYIARAGGKVTALLLFRRDGNTIVVHNEAIALAEADIERFAAAMFATYPRCGAIRFQAIETTLARLPFPFQRYNCLEDIVATLPATEDAYFAALGKNMRASLKRYQKKIAAELPALRYEIHEGAAIDARDVAGIVALSSARIAGKRQVPTHSAARTAELTRLVSQCGVMLVARNGAQLCAGVICSMVGGNLFMHVVAHDPAYDELRLGKVCCYLSIRDAIARGAAHYHFLWGRYEYKYRLLGVQRELDRVVVYRSPASLLLNGRLALATALRGHGRRLKRWLAERELLSGTLAERGHRAWRLLARRA